MKQVVLINDDYDVYAYVDGELHGYVGGYPLSIEALNVFTKSSPCSITTVSWEEFDSFVDMDNLPKYYEDTQ